MSDWGGQQCLPFNPQKQAEIMVGVSGQKFMGTVASQVRVKVSCFQNM